MKREHVDKQTGEVTEGELNKVIVTMTRRKNGTLRVQRDFKYCPTLAEQHSARETDLNYLIKKYSPDELGAYMAAREQYRQELIGHDFSNEPSLEDARNATYKLKQAFETLDENIKNQFKNHVEFLKFIDNPANQEKMIKLGLMDKKEIQKHTDPLNNDDSNDDKKGSDKKTTTKHEPHSQSKT